MDSSQFLEILISWKCLRSKFKSEFLVFSRVPGGAFSREDKKMGQGIRNGRCLLSDPLNINGTVGRGATINRAIIKICTTPVLIRRKREELLPLVLLFFSPSNRFLSLPLLDYSSFRPTPSRIDQSRRIIELVKMHSLRDRFLPIWGSCSSPGFRN